MISSEEENVIETYLQTQLWMTDDEKKIMHILFTPDYQFQGDLNKLKMEIRYHLVKNKIRHDAGIIEIGCELVHHHRSEPWYASASVSYTHLDVYKRQQCNRIQSLPGEIALMIHNLPAGYHRDFQLLKDVMMPKIQILKSVLDIANYMLQHISVNADLIKQEKYQYLFSVERVNELVLSGIPFRDAYKQVGAEIESGKFVPNYNICLLYTSNIDLVNRIILNFNCNK